MTTSQRFPLIVAGAALVMLLGASPALASHSWGNYHWARTSNPFTLKLGNNVTGAWPTYLFTASNDWSKDPAILFPDSGITKVLTTTVVAGSGGRTCKAISGTVQVCDRTYGSNGWLGLAQIWTSGSHIVAGTVKMNDTYFNTATYNTAAWKTMVMCQEIGHTFGLDHQDEDFYNANLGTCMDYTDNPARNDGAGDNEHPNFHDYEELDIVYSHLDSSTTLSSSIVNRGASNLAKSDTFENAAEWGRAIQYDKKGNPSLYMRDLGNGDALFTFVTWVQ